MLFRISWRKNALRQLFELPINKNFKIITKIFSDSWNIESIFSTALSVGEINKINCGAVYDCLLLLRAYISIRKLYSSLPFRSNIFLRPTTRKSYSSRDLSAFLFCPCCIFKKIHFWLLFAPYFSTFFQFLSPYPICQCKHPHAPVKQQGRENG
jgi:hypothetical protein